MKSIKINDNLFLNILPVIIPKNKEEELKTTEVQNQFLIFDRSGSMTGYLDSIMDTAIEYCDKLPEGSTVSLGYFSGTGQYNLTIPYTLKKEMTGVITTLDDYRRSIGLTNFIEILDKLNTIASKVNTKSSLFFFTDGYHNTGGGMSEIEKALKEWTKYAGVSMFVGYGYIDRDTMTWMANITEGSFVHLNNFNNFKRTLEDFGESVEDCSPFIEIKLPSLKEDIIPISISGRSILQYIVDNDTIKYKPSKKGYKGIFFTTSYKLDNTEEIDKIDTTIERGLRALAIIHSQKNNTVLSLDLLSHIGDKYLIQSLYNSITSDEFSEAETKIRKSIFSTSERFLEGMVKDFLPDPNAFCVLDAIYILSNDPGVKIHVTDKDFEYVRIGKKTKSIDGPSVQYPDDVTVNFNKIVFNQERLNVSISTQAEGTLNLLSENFKLNPPKKEELEKLNLSPTFPISTYRTYSIIADGKVQTKKMVVSNLSKETINSLGAILTRRADDKYIVDFSTLPVINRSYVKMTSAKSLAMDVWKEKLLMDEISVYNYLKRKTEQETGKIAFKKSNLTEEQATYLFEHCYIKNGSYNPPVEIIAGNDQYDAYKFSINIKGFSKATASAVIEKIRAGKKPTQREMLLSEAYEIYRKDKNFDSTSKDFLEKIVSKLAELNKELNITRKDIQSFKFAIILGNKGRMDEFTSREDMNLELEMESLFKKILKITFEFKIEKTAIEI